MANEVNNLGGVDLKEDFIGIHEDISREIQLLNGEDCREQKSISPINLNELSIHDVEVSDQRIEEEAPRLGA